jgi:hypothetical protein
MPYAGLDPDAHVLTNPSPADLARAAREVAPPSLMVMDYRLDGFEPLQAFRDLVVLKIQGAANVRDLIPLAALTTLRELVIATPPGSAGSGRTIDVASYAPLTQLTALERLVLIAVRPLDGDLTVLGRMTHLRELGVSGVREFTLEDYARLAIALPGTASRDLVPYCTIPGIGVCKACRGQQVLLTGAPPRARKWLCPTCQAKGLAAHVARWDAVKAAAVAAAKQSSR